MKKWVIILFFMTLLVSSVVIADESGGILIGKRDNCIQLPQECADCTYVKLTTVTYPNMSKLSIQVNMNQDSTSFSYNFCYTNLTGSYIYCMVGDVGGTATVVCKDFSITPNGELSTTGTAVLYIGLLAVLIFFLSMSIYSFITFDNLLSRVGTLGISYLLLMAITFVGWNMAGDFLTSAPFLVSMLRIIFFVLMAGFFPFVIGGFIWYFVMLFKVKEIERLMSKGMPQEEAERRQGGKYK